MEPQADIMENELIESHPAVLATLLFDRTTGNNILWATDAYASLGHGYYQTDEITTAAITGSYGFTIQPRALKSKDEQSRRAKQMAEVFTPAWICKKMNDLFDREYPLRPNDDSWRTYALATCLEITCGEAPFLQSRYDTVTGRLIPIDQRGGLLDRKLRAVALHATAEEYLPWSLATLGSVYGYEWQGDSLLLAREALLATYAEHYRHHTGILPTGPTLQRAAEIISWNLFQMDGLKAVVPYSCHAQPTTAGDLFGTTPLETTFCPGCANGDILRHNGLRPRLRRWTPQMFSQVADEASDPELAETNTFTYIDIIKLKQNTYTQNQNPMKFNFVIGNPPYQEELKDTSDKPVYDKYMDGAYQIADKVELITPARFLFNAGKTPKVWNEKMLRDPHLKVLLFEQDSSRIFPTTDIKGGVAITYHDLTKRFDAIDVFTSYPELNSILRKVKSQNSDSSLTSIIYVQNKFDLDSLYKDYPQYKTIIGSNGKERRLTAAILYQLDLFKEQKSTHDDIAIWGVINNKRVIRYISQKYIDSNQTNLSYWKVLVPKSNGSGAIGEVLSTPLIGEPLIGYTQTFISIGKFESEAEAKAAYKYICTKFARTMLGILKITQDNPPEKWKYVPLQDFTEKSDIDWTQSIHDIDRQLYRKYGLDQTEQDFIERMVKPME